MKNTVKKEAISYGAGMLTIYINDAPERVDGRKVQYSDSPEKIGFNYENKFINVGVERFIASEKPDFKTVINVDGVDFFIDIKKETLTNGKTNYCFRLNSKFFETEKTFYGFNDIERKINYSIREYKFNGFNNLTN
jgi:hypothetical protein